MKLYDGGLVIALIVATAIAFSYIAGVGNWATHCEPGGLDPPGCPKQTTQTKEAK